MINKMFHFRLMSLFIVKHLIIPFNLNRLKGNASKEVPNLHLRKLLMNYFPKDSLLPVQTIIVAHPDHAKLMHNGGSPPPSPPNLNAIPNFVFN